MTHKKCSDCQETLLLSAFANDKSKKDGKRARCRACQRVWNVTHGEQKRAAQRKYAAKPEARYAKYVASAKSRGFPWTLTRDEFMQHWAKPCVHCGSPIKTIGLDRVDSSKPYEDGNVEPCCASHNRQKSDMTTKDWYDSMDSVTYKRIKDNGGSEHLIGLLKDILNTNT